MSLKFRVYILTCVLFFALLVSTRNLPASDPVVLNDYAIQLMQKGEIEKAIEQLQSASSLFPYDTTLRKNLAELYTVLGQRRMSVGKYEQAATSFDNARELFPDSQRYSVLRGVALYSARQYDAAIVEFERARGLGSDSSDLLLFLGKAHYDTGNLQGAIEAWDKGLEIEPERKELVTLVARARREFLVEGRMDKGYSSRFSVSYDSGNGSGLADSILDVLENAYNRIGSDFSYFPNIKIPVLVYTKTDYRSLTNSPDWSGGLYDGKIRFPVGGATEMNPILRSLLFHEYTHVLVQELTSGNCPMWLNEGLAEIEGRRDFDHPMKELEAAVRQKALLPLSQMERSFSSLNPKDVGLAYQQSYSFVKYLVATFGWHKVKDILVTLGTGKSISDAVSIGLSDFSVTYAGVYQEWLAGVEKEFSR